MSGNQPYPKIFRTVVCRDLRSKAFGKNPGRIGGKDASGHRLTFVFLVIPLTTLDITQTIQI